jgi:hypothetical protein
MVNDGEKLSAQKGGNWVVGNKLWKKQYIKTEMAMEYPAY